METLPSKTRYPLWEPLLLLASLLLFLLPYWLEIEQKDLMGYFVLNYVLSLGYTGILLVQSIIKRSYKPKVERLGFLALFFLLSAFALNREITLIEHPSTWLVIALIILGLVITLLRYRESLPTRLQVPLFLLLGAGSLIYLYFCLYFIPLYHIGAIGLVAFGITCHLFVPFLLLCISIYYLVSVYRHQPILFKVWIMGAGLSLSFTVTYALLWHQAVKRINQNLNHILLDDRDVPLWITMSQQSPSGYFNELVLKAPLLYSIPDWNHFFDPDRFNIRNNGWSELREHNPLVTVATAFSEMPDLDEASRVRILESQYDHRHQSAERLWRGDALRTANVISNVMIYPEYRLAYTEKILSIDNTSSPNRMPSQEAYYTFYLPEGSIVTSLSLWINGQEEKGVLTTKGKADTAYKTIVGVEQRDPSLVHWQEGNRVTVRVFPCTPQENRKFKLGISSPLRKTGNQLHYENIYFDGPSARGATETIKVRFSQLPNETDLPFDFSKEADAYFIDKDYQAYWEISMAAPPLAANSFSFNNEQYSLSAYTPAYEAFEADAYILDLNNSWTREEVLQLWEQLKTKPVYVYQDQLLQVSAENFTAITERGLAERFSLLPIYSLKNFRQPLILSKSPALSPNLSDLKATAWTKHLEWRPGIRLYNLGTQLSPYLKSLKELRFFTYDEGSTEQLLQLLNKKQFVANPESDSQLVIHHAGILLNRKAGKGISQAPDHLQRLFAYNAVMKAWGEHYQHQDSLLPELIKTAETAYVVSPISSLIVLETQQDYERFDIKTPENSLLNASMKSSGAVPEPHEWALLILAALLIAYLHFKPVFFRS